MAPLKQPSLASLFHPKKGVKQESPAPTRQTLPSSSATRPRTPRPPPVDEDEDGRLPEGPYQEFRLLSSALNGWKYDVMKFDSRKTVDLGKWTVPIKLNRKDLRRDDGTGEGLPLAVGPMLGLDGKPVVGADGRWVMVDAEGHPIRPPGEGGAYEKGKGSGVGGKKRFMKKTRQVFKIPEEVRQLRREERYPWVLEDSSPSNEELWIGQMEDVTRSETHAFFMPAANDIFKFVPAHRWYRFQKKVKHDLPTDTANVDALYTRNQKRDPQVWLASRNGKGPSSATTAMFKAEAEGQAHLVSNSLVMNSSESLGPGGRKLKTVDNGMGNLFDDDEDGDTKRKREKEFGEEGDLDEQVYENDFADDEEKMDEEGEEAKELEERLKREYQTANKIRDPNTVDSDESDGGTQKTSNKQTKVMEKLIRKREGNDVYGSDDEENPYASSEEEEEEKEIPVATGPAIQVQPQQVESRPQTPKPNVPRTPLNGSSHSHAASPAASPSLGGHSVVAKRATSPQVPRSRPVADIVRSHSPLDSRPRSPLATRTDSPVDEAKINLSNKRKAEESPGGVSPHSVPTSAPKMKKRKAIGAGVVPVIVSAADLEAMLIGWLKTTVNATTRDCIHHFTPYLTDGEKKTEFSGMVRKVAQLKNGVLVLRQCTSAA